MPNQVILPELGEDIQTAVVVCWHCKAGDTVQAGDDIVELVTDKATFNVAAETSGILERILVPEGREARIGEPLAIIVEKKSKVLLMYITKVSGHRAATVAIENSLKTLEPNLDIFSINGFGYTYPILEQVVNRTYMSVIKRTPKVWDYLYDNPKLISKTTSIKEFLHKTSHKKLARLFKKFPADTVVCTQAFPCGMVADYKRAYGLNFTLIGVLTDYAPHSFWLNKGVDYYIVPTEEARDRFMQQGVPGDSIKVYGIPIQLKFSKHLDKAPIAARLGLDLAIPTVLIMGGGQGLGPIKKVVKSLLKRHTPMQLIILAGTNKKILKWLQRKKKKSEKKMVIFEFVDNVDELMDLATLVITKPGGMTTSECLAKGLPMVIVNPIPGQETRNTDFLLKKGIAIRIDKTNDIGEEIDLLLRNPQRLNAMSQAAYTNGRPFAALDISKLILGVKQTKQPLTVNVMSNS